MNIIKIKKRGSDQGLSGKIFQTLCHTSGQYTNSDKSEDFEAISDIIENTLLHLPGQKVY